MIWTRELARNVLERALRLSGADETEVRLDGGATHLTRFANNTIHQNISHEGRTLSVRCVLGMRSGRATTDRLDDQGLRDVVAAATAIARETPEDPDLLPVAEPQGYTERHHHDPATAGCPPEARARRAGAAIEAARAAGTVAAGFAATGESIEALATSRGCFAFYQATQAGFSVTMTAEDSTGWVNQTAIALEDLEVPALAGRAIEKARAGAQPRDCPPGEYTVILEPPAVYDLMLFLQDGFGGRQVLEKESFLTDRLGEAVFGGGLDLWDDVTHPLQDGAFFDGEGTPRQVVRLIDRGVACGLVHDRDSARKLGLDPTGHAGPYPDPVGAVPGNLVVAGGSASLEDLIRGTEDGILVSRFWYTRMVEPMQVVLTGMTRDGTFRIQGGRVVHGIRNLRYHQSVVAMLNRVTGLGKSVRVAPHESPTMVLPAMKVEGFRFISAARH